jgi:hypothetical protein
MSNAQRKAHHKAAAKNRKQQASTSELTHSCGRHAKYVSEASRCLMQEDAITVPVSKVLAQPIFRPSGMRKANAAQRE